MKAVFFILVGLLILSIPFSYITYRLMKKNNLPLIGENETQRWLSVYLIMPIFLIQLIFKRYF